MQRSLKIFHSLFILLLITEQISYCIYHYHIKTRFYFSTNSQYFQVLFGILRRDYQNLVENRVVYLVGSDNFFESLNIEFVLIIYKHNLSTFILFKPHNHQLIAQLSLPRTRFPIKVQKPVFVDYIIQQLVILLPTNILLYSLTVLLLIFDLQHPLNLPLSIVDLFLRPQNLDQILILLLQNLIKVHKALLFQLLFHRKRYYFLRLPHY